MSSKSITSAQLAKRYAAALLARAQETKEVGFVGERLEMLAALDAQSPEFHMLLASAVWPENDRKCALEAVCEKLNLSGTVSSFLGVLNENGRLSLLPEIEKIYARMRLQAEGVLFVKVVSAAALSETVAARLTETLAGVYKKEVRLEVSIDDSLIAGISVQIGSDLIDGSLKTKLQKLTQVMKGVA